MKNINPAHCKASFQIVIDAICCAEDIEIVARALSDGAMKSIVQSRDPELKVLSVEHKQLYVFAP